MSNYQDIIRIITGFAQSETGSQQPNRELQSTAASAVQLLTSIRTNKSPGKKLTPMAAYVWDLILWHVVSGRNSIVVRF